MVRRARFCGLFDASERLARGVGGKEIREDNLVSMGGSFCVKGFLLVYPPGSP
jgi:hypothetical protein